MDGFPKKQDDSGHLHQIRMESYDLLFESKIAATMNKIMDCMTLAFYLSQLQHMRTTLPSQQVLDEKFPQACFYLGKNKNPQIFKKKNFYGQKKCFPKRNPPPNPTLYETLDSFCYSFLVERMPIHPATASVSASDDMSQWSCWHFQSGNHTNVSETFNWILDHQKAWSAEMMLGISPSTICSQLMSEREGSVRENWLLIKIPDFQCTNDP